MVYGAVRAMGIAASLLTGFMSTTALAQLAPATVMVPAAPALPVAGPAVVPVVIQAPVAAPAAAPAVLVPAVVQTMSADEDLEPKMPAGSSPNFVPPAHDAAGYITPNRSLSSEETMWHVRVALNVAALGCRGAEATEMVSGYNALLTADKEVLAAASTAMGARYKARYGTAWQARHDDAMTKLYNFWALPPAQGKFCGVALAVVREAATVQPAAFAAFAATALPRLEAPLVAYFAEFETYLTAREQWRTRRARAMIAAAVPANGAPAVPAVAAPAQAVAVAVPVGAPVAVAVPAATAGAAPATVIVVPVAVQVSAPVRASVGEP